MTLPDSGELRRMVDARHIDAAPCELTASAGECAALARRFGWVSVAYLTASVALERDGSAVRATGHLTADIVQSCAISGEDLPVHVAERLALRFVPEGQHRPDEEIEIDAAACDEIDYAGTSFDLGEAIAQSLALATDPFAVGPHAAKVRASGLLGETPARVFDALKQVKFPEDNS